jgi:hypothetical protein
MRDPHVVELRYRLKTEETVTFDNPPLLERDGGILSMCTLPTVALRSG